MDTAKTETKTAPVIVRVRKLLTLNSFDKIKLPHEYIMR
jgi:hypothetical protein